MSLVRRGGDGADTRTGRRRPGGLRTQRRRRFHGRGDDRAPRDWRSADVHLRGQRRDAPGRGGADQDALRAPEAAARVRRRVAALSRSAGRVTDPEQKRKIIGAAFIDVFEAEATKLGSFDFLAQGTLYPDVIESVSVIGPSHVIKSHHNVGGLPERMRFKLVEPLRQLFKDEVRALGSELGSRRRVRLAPAVPGSRPGGPDPRGGQRHRASP